MQRKAYLVSAGLILALTISAIGAEQEKTIFTARLSPVALDTPMRATITGSGSATASLSGSKLTVSGEFEGMKSAATVAHIHSGAVTGVRGPAILDLTVEKAPSGKLSGSFNLTAEQIDSLRKGHLYIQVHSEKAPDGNLWGWLLPQGGS